MEKKKEAAPPIPIAGEAFGEVEGYGDNSLQVKFLGEFRKKSNVVSNVLINGHQAHQCVLDEAHRLSRKAWNHEQQKYKQRLRSSFSERGGRDAFQCIKKGIFT